LDKGRESAVNERAVLDTAKSGSSGKLVKFPLMPAQNSGPTFRKYWLSGGLVSVLLLAAVVWWILSGPSKVHYTTVPVARGAITRSVIATGTVNPELTIIVGAYDSGVIQELYCDYNTPVKKGQVCAKIDPRPYQTVVDQNKANLAVAKAQLEKDKANLAYTKLTLDRDAKLVQTNAVSQDSFDNAKSTYDQALATVTFDEATIQQRQAALDAAQVVSPVDGIVVSRNVTMGQTVASSFQTPTLFLIASDLTKMEVDTNVSESDVGDIKQGDKSTFTVDAFPKRTFEGTVSQVRQSPQTVQNVVTYDIVVSAGNSDLALMPGMTTANRIITDQRNDVIRVPNQALRYTPSALAGMNGSSQPKIWVLRDEQPISVPVVIGIEDDNFTEIVSGDVKADDLVIIAEQIATGGESTMPSLRF
jgi:HlyD family secretion protein